MMPMPAVNTAKTAIHLRKPSMLLQIKRHSPFQAFSGGFGVRVDSGFEP